MTEKYGFVVNGLPVSVSTDGATPLLSVLRDDLNLRGSKFGCGTEQCGACMVLIDGKPEYSCARAVAAVAGTTVTTVEGLSGTEGLHPLQQALLDVGAFQCAYCASGMIMSGAALLAKNPNPTDAEIVRFMEGNVCRCGGYGRIVEAIKLAASRMRGGAR